MSPTLRPAPIAALSAGTVLAAAVILRAMGRVAWCACGSWSPVSWDVWSRHNSQHVLDPYTFSHVQHGLVFYAVLALVLGRAAPGVRLALAVALEAAWEVLENTPMVIEHYRQATVSLDYTGDSIANSVSDVLACTLGWLAAHRVPVAAAVGAYVAIEVAMIAAIRDSLILNVWMLVWPVEAVKQWQLGG